MRHNDSYGGEGGRTHDAAPTPLTNATQASHQDSQGNVLPSELQEVIQSLSALASVLRAGILAIARSGRWEEGAKSQTNAVSIALRRLRNGMM